MQIKTIVTGPFQGNTYIIWGDGERRAVIIDPGDEADRLMEELTADQLHLGAILATHAHLDHVGGVEELRHWSKAPVCIPEGEREVLSWLPESYQFFGLPAKSIPQVDFWLDNNTTDLSDILSPEHIGNLDIHIHQTPGHTPGGVCYAVGNQWFVGDTLFFDSIGRIDLPGGNWSVLRRSLRSLLTLPDDTVIYPGHGPRTTIGREKKANPFLQDLYLEDESHA